MAADKLVFQSGYNTMGIKIRRIGKLLAGYSGAMSLAEEFFAWLAAGYVKEDCPPALKGEGSGTGMVINEKRQIMIFDRSAVFFLVDHHQHAIGSGGEVAAACLYLGHSAQEAVGAVSAVSALCGNGMDVLVHDDFKPVRSRKKT